MGSSHQHAREVDAHASDVGDEFAEVVGGTGPEPFGLDVLESSEEELSEGHPGFDEGEGGFADPGASFVGLLPLCRFRNSNKT